MNLLPLVNGGFATVSPEDFDSLSAHKWRAVEVRPRYVYACRNVGVKRLYMHRLITECPAGLVVDHISGNTLDNRRENLRCVTAAVNSQNRNEPVTAASGERYVLSHKRGYIVRVVRNGVRHYGGFHKDVPAAVAARDLLLADLEAALGEVSEVTRLAHLLREAA